MGYKLLLITMSSLQLHNMYERIKNYVPRNQEHKHQQHVLDKYKNKNIEIAYIKLKTDHDGYDEYGPQSNLYNFYVYYRIGYDYYFDVWNREDWYSGDDDDPYSLTKYKNKYIDYRDKELIKYIKNNHPY